MQSKNTLILALVTLGIIIAAVAAGIATQTPPPAPQPEKHESKPLPTQAELQSRLATEQPVIDQALTAAYPQLGALYIINPGKLYHDGTWYGTTLTYKGTDAANRDTLRLLMHKQAGEWVVSSRPPAIILRAADYPNAPKTVIQDINQPAPLPGTVTSPSIQ